MTVMTKRKPTDPDFARVTSLEDVPEVAATAHAARQDQLAMEALGAQWTVLQRRAQSSDRVEQLDAGLALRTLGPEVQRAEAQAEKTRRAAETTREATRRRILDARRGEFEARLTTLLERWGEAESEAARVLSWLHELSGVVGDGALSDWYQTIPIGLRPGTRQEWIDSANRWSGWNF